jgi:Trk-type K+ transport system membrane component
MKISLTLGRSRPLTRGEAKGCFTANLALPGSGSLVAGRAVGYFQLSIYLVSFIVTILGAASFFHWYLTHQNDMVQPTSDDPFGSIVELWQHVRLAMVGIGLFLFATSWAIVTSLQIMCDSPKQSAPPIIR